ncbi:metal-dependent transcriptional regulator [Candidatus Kaiserbacteria bacterium]|nr:metal-dependent transcriptional regulator [Candidatus Kaiserbacteria bacterium]
MRTISKTQILSATKEDYVRAIYTLQESSDEAGVTQIADKLGLSKSTVSERLKDLAQDGFVIANPYSQVELTKKGVDAGKKLTYKHRLIEVFLHSVLKVPKDKVHEEAHRLEHACSDEVIQKLAKFLDYPENDPHGTAIPKIDKWN